MARAIKITSVSGALTVTITGPNGGTPVVYADSSFSATRSMPATIADTATTTFWLQGPGRYTLSVKTSGGTEIAADNNSTRTVDVETDGTVAALNYDARTLATVSGDSGHSTAGSAASGGATYITASGDTTGATDGAAINAAITAANAAGGGIVEIVGTCWTNIPIVPKPGVWLRGRGWLASSINLATAANCTVILPGTSFFFGKISNLTIDGWKENQGAGAWRGIDLSGISATHGGATTSQYVGGLGITVEDVLVRSTKSTAVYVDTNGSVETRLTNVYTYGADGDGYFLSGSDIFALNCTAGGSLGHGFNVSALGARLNDCKSWQSGWSWSRTFTSTYPTGGDATKHGYHVTGANCTLIACEGQDNAGVSLNMGGDCCHAYGHMADANLGGAYQLYINARRCSIYGEIGNGTSHGTPSPWAVNIFDSSAIGNTVRISWPNNAGGATAGIASAAKVNAPQNDIVIGTPHAVVVTTYAATVTPDPLLAGPEVTLTGNITIANPATDRYVPGTEFEIRLIQDAIGGRTVTWGADYIGMSAADTTPNAVNTWKVRCRYIGGAAKWYQVGAPTNYALKLDRSGGQIYTTGAYYASPFASYQGNGMAIFVGTAYARYFPVGELHTFVGIGLQISGVAATSSVRLGIYTDSDGLPGALIVDAGTIDPAVAGEKVATISQALSGGVWLVAIPQGSNNPSALKDNGMSAGIGTSAMNTQGQTHITATLGTIASLPATWPAGAPSFGSGPMLYLKA